MIEQIARIDAGSLDRAAPAQSPADWESAVMAAGPASQKPSEANRAHELPRVSDPGTAAGLQATSGEDTPLPVLDPAPSTLERQGVSANPYIVTAPGDASLEPGGLDTVVEHIADQIRSGLAGKDPDAEVELKITYKNGKSETVGLGMVKDLKNSNLMSLVKGAVSSADGQYRREENYIAIQGAITLAEIAANAMSRPDTVKPTQPVLIFEYDQRSGAWQLPQSDQTSHQMSAFAPAST